MQGQEHGRKNPFPVLGTAVSTIGNKRFHRLETTVSYGGNERFPIGELAFPYIGNANRTKYNQFKYKRSMKMKASNLWYGLLCMLAVSVSLSSCSDDNGNNDDDRDDTGSKVQLPQVRAFFLNEGSYNGNNAGISFYAPNGDADFISDIYSYQNDAKLGDTGQCMIEYEGEIYVAVYGSNYLAKLNSAGVEQQRLSFVTDPELSAGIRYLAAEDGYIYASFWGGVVAKINTQTLKVESKLTELGDNLEGVAICKDMLYVANSCTPDWSAYHKEVKVIDLNTFTLKETLTVDLNPNTLIEEEDKIFLISWGNYVDVGYSLQMIDPNNNNQVTPLGEVTKMGAGNDMLYLTYSSYTNPETKFFSYNIRTGQMDQTSFLKDIPEELKTSTIYMIAVDDEYNGDIYISTTDYKTNGTIYRFKKDGTFVEKFDAGGISPNSAVFFN